MKNNKLRLSRFMVFFIFVAGCFIVIAGRFFQVQVLQGEEYARKFRNQCYLNVPVKAHRGAIYDRNGNPLAYTTETENLLVYTDSDETIEKIAREAAPILDVSESSLLKKLMARKGKQVLIARKIDPGVSTRINALKIPEIYSKTEFDRIYPYNSAVSALVGYLNHEFEAKAGAEVYCDKYLKGKDGLRACMKAGSGQLYPIFSEPLIEPVEGNDVYLTIDIEYQQILSEEIRTAVDEWSAVSGMGVLMEVATGKILAVYHYDPELKDPDYKCPKARAITDLFEPGSTFKTVVFGALLEEGLINLADTIYAGNGSFKFNGISIHDDKKHDIISVAEAFIISSNVATGRLANILGPKMLYRYAREMGFGLPTGLGFPGEVNGRLHEPEVWSEYYCAMLSIGHEVSASTLQMARMFGCIANDGRLMKPILLDRVISPTGGTQQRFYPEQERKIFSESTIASLKKLCEIVVDTGTAKYAKIDGIDFAGKTGTAEKPSETGGYDKSRYIASFGGYFPADDPQICGIIIIDEPKEIHYGGITAGPAFAKTAKRITDLENRKNETSGRTIYASIDALKSGALNLLDEDYEGDPDVMIKHADYKLDTKAEINPVGESEWVRLPDLRNKSARDAFTILNSMGLKCSLKGAGYVIATVPERGESVVLGDHVMLVCEDSKKEGDD
ncbi:MAG TPA: PASTA domain-containing protein [candidate division Zixibacteria bacterium]|nr:PASTA domain-containing protein [candidate division Zixibacteria bacterium]HEQ99111.1 PASTA domain-containing protein [candidate division Zixibacteria bacterium]